MVMTPDEAVEAVQTNFERWESNHEKMSMLDRWHRNTLNDEDLPHLPRTTEEYRQLRQMSLSPWGRLLVDLMVQFLYVDGYRDDQGQSMPAWDVWQANLLDDRQARVHEGAAALGLSYVKVLPGRDRLTMSRMPQIKGMSARKSIALYEDPANDEWPRLFLTGEKRKVGDVDGHRFELVDDAATYTVDRTSGTDAKVVSTVRHGVGVCPVIRFAPRMDIEGRAVGEIEPVINVMRRLNQTTFDRLIVQRFGAWVVRWATGLEEPSPEEGETAAEVRQAMKLRLSIEDILVSEGPETKFGALQGTDMRPYTEATVAEARAFAAITQTPPHALLGEMTNLSAEALTAAEMGHKRKVDQAKQALGESWEQVFRLAAHIQGDRQGAAAWDAQVRWRDTESRSLAQVADALGKLAQMLQVPPQALWERIPGVTQTDVEAWKAMAADSDMLARLFDDVVRQAEPVEAA